MLAKKKNGTNTTDISPRTTVSAEKPRSRKMLQAQQRLGQRSSQTTNATISATPTAMQPQVATLLQPQTLDCCSPSTIRPIAPVISTVPR